jgi:hypothetical protein
MRFGYVVLCMMLVCSIPYREDPSDYLTREDSVHLVVVRYLEDANLSPERLLVISDTTIELVRFPSDTTGILSLYETFIQDLPPELILDLRARASRRIPLNLAVFELSQPQTLRRSELRYTPVEDSIGLFRSPDGHEVFFAALSRVGFDGSGSFALVHQSGTCGSRCGGPGLILLRRAAEGKWEVARTTQGTQF